MKQDCEKSSYINKSLYTFQILSICSINMFECLHIKYVSIHGYSVSLFNTSKTLSDCAMTLTKFLELNSSLFIRTSHCSKLYTLHTKTNFGWLP